MLRLLLLTTLTNSVIKVSHCTVSASVSMALRSVDFEIFGRVQGVFFRKYTKNQADKLGLKGWCMNTSRGTVQGQMQGPNDKVESMMQWLKTTGSPSSKIDKSDFTNNKEIDDYTFKSFDIRQDD